MADRTHFTLHTSHVALRASHFAFRTSHFALRTSSLVVESLAMPTFRKNSKFEIRNSKLPAICLLAVAGVLASGCRTNTDPAQQPRGGVQVPGEPVNYSANVSRTFDDGTNKVVTVSRVARLGEMLREQWSENGETFVSIWRPDLGKVYLLCLERKVYMESELNDDWKPEVRSAIAGLSGVPRLDPDAVDRAFDYEDPSEHDETDELPGETVDGRPCRVLRQRTVFANGLIETTKTFRAPELEGLAVRVESETDGPATRIRIVTERLDIRTDVTPDQLEIPTGFKRVDSLVRR